MDEAVVFEMDRPICALGESLAQYRLGAGRAGGDRDYLAAVLFLLSQRLFEGIGIGFVHFVRDVFANPGPGFIQLERRVFLGDLLDTDKNLHRGYWAAASV